MSRSVIRQRGSIRTEPDFVREMKGLILETKAAVQRLAVLFQTHVHTAPMRPPDPAFSIQTVLTTPPTTVTPADLLPIDLDLARERLLAGLGVPAEFMGVKETLQQENDIATLMEHVQFVDEEEEEKEYFREKFPRIAEMRDRWEAEEKEWEEERDRRWAAREAVCDT